MKFNKSSQLLLVSAASLVAAGRLSQPAPTLTVDFVYVTSCQSRRPQQLWRNRRLRDQLRVRPHAPDSHLALSLGRPQSRGRGGFTDNANLYVVNQDDNTIVQFIIGNDGKLYPHNTVNTPGVFPLAIAVTGSNLFVADTYQPLPTCSPAAPCSGSVASFPVGSNGNLGSPAVNSALSTTYWPLTVPGSPNNVVVPTAVNAVPGGATSLSPPMTPRRARGYVFGFASSGGVLTPLNGGTSLSRRNSSLRDHQRSERKLSLRHRLRARQHPRIRHQFGNPDSAERKSVPGRGPACGDCRSTQRANSPWSPTPRIPPLPPTPSAAVRSPASAHTPPACSRWPSASIHP